MSSSKNENQTNYKRVKEIPLYTDVYESFVFFPDDKKGSESFIKRMLQGNNLSEEKINALVNDQSFGFQEALKFSIFRRMGYTNQEAENLARDKSLVVKDGVGAIDANTEYGDFSDFPVSPFTIYKDIEIVTPPIDHNEDGRIKQNPDPQKEKSEEAFKEKRQSMIDQYYGNKDAEKERRKRYKRLRSHIGTKEINVIDKDGNKRKLTIKTIEDYPERKEDAKRLNLEGLKSKIERLSRAEQGDFSVYEVQAQLMVNQDRKKVLQKYMELKKTDPKFASEFYNTANRILDKCEKGEERQSLIQALIEQDSAFVQTNNFTYDQRKTTQENLKTLGKDGEQSQKAQISVDQKTLAKMGLRTMNAFIAVRNHTLAPINKAIGTYIVSPLHKKIFKVGRTKEVAKKNVNGYFIEPVDASLEIAQDNSIGTFKNKPLHRYEARKDYYSRIVRRQILAKMQKKDPNYNDGDVRRVTVGSQIKMAFLPRIYALAKFQEGNKAVLSAGLKDIENGAKARQNEIDSKNKRINDNNDRIKTINEDIKKTQLLLKMQDNEKIKFMLESHIKELIEEGREIISDTALVKDMETASVATDAVSLSEHNKANKALITTVVHGIKWGARVGAAKLISQYIHRKVLDHYEKEKVGEKVETIDERKEVINYTEPGAKKKVVEKSTLQDFMTSEDGQVHYNIDTTTGMPTGNEITQNGDKIRGIAFKYTDSSTGPNGKIISANDASKIAESASKGAPKFGKEFTPEMDTIEAVQEALKDNGLDYTKEQVQDMIANGQIKDLSLWMSYKDTGTPMGWTIAKQPAVRIVQGEPIHKTKIITHPAKKIVTPIYDDVAVYKDTINPIAIVAEAGIVADSIAGINESLRHNRSTRDQEYRSKETLKAMSEENEEKINNEDSNNRKKDPNPKAPEQGEMPEGVSRVDSNKETNKSHLRDENYDLDFGGFVGIGGRTTFGKFLLWAQGKKGKGDFEKYDENEIPGLVYKKDNKERE